MRQNWSSQLNTFTINLQILRKVTVFMLTSMNHRFSLNDANDWRKGTVSHARLRYTRDYLASDMINSADMKNRCHFPPKSHTVLLKSKKSFICVCSTSHLNRMEYRMTWGHSSNVHYLAVVLVTSLGDFIWSPECQCIDREDIQYIGSLSKYIGTHPLRPVTVFETDCFHIQNTWLLLYFRYNMGARYHLGASPWTGNSRFQRENIRRNWDSIDG